MAERKVTVTINPEMQYRRELQYKEKLSGWQVFKAVYWSIYIFIIGVLLLTIVPQVLNTTAFAGWALALLAMFIVVYGFVISLHLKLMKKHG